MDQPHQGCWHRDPHTMRAAAAGVKFGDGKRLGSGCQPEEAKRAQRWQLLLAAGSFPKGSDSPCRMPQQWLRTTASHKSTCPVPKQQEKDAQCCKPALIGSNRGAQPRPGTLDRSEQRMSSQHCILRAMRSPATSREKHAATQLSICTTLGDAGLPTKGSSSPSAHTLVKCLLSHRPVPPSPTYQPQTGKPIPTSWGWRGVVLLGPMQVQTGMKPEHLPAL